MYEIESFEGSSQTIRLAKTGSTSSTDSLVSIQFAPPLEYSPALPWNIRTQNGEIKLYPALDDNYFEDGGVQIIANNKLCYVEFEQDRLKTASGSEIASIADMERNQQGQIKWIQFEYFRNSVGKLLHRWRGY